MSYEPLTPYKSKDDPLWYVFDENQNFKTFDTKDKALKHIRATKFPTDKPIDLDTAYKDPNIKKEVQDKITKIDSMNVAEGNDTAPVKPIEPPKNEYVTDEKKEEISDESSEIPWYRQLTNPGNYQIYGAFERGARGFAKTTIGGGSKAISEPFINSPYGYSLDDLNFKTDDPNHKEYLDAYKYLEEIKPSLMSEGTFTHENVNKLLKEKGFVNSRLSNAGTLWTELSVEQQNENLSNSVIHTTASHFEDFIMKNPITVESWDEIDDTYVNMFVESLPNVAGIIGTMVVNPMLGMSVAGTMMAGESWTLAEPYIEKGEVTPSDAGAMALFVGVASMGINFFPATIWNKNPITQKAFEKALFNKLVKKKAYKELDKASRLEIVTEAFTEAMDENILMYGEGQYRDISLEERTERTAVAFTLGGVVSTMISGSLNISNKSQLSEVFNNEENMKLPSLVNIDKNGDINFNIKEEHFKNKEDYEYVKNIIDDPKLKKRLNPTELIKKHPNIPINLVMFHELISENPNLADIEINFNAVQKTDYLTEEELIARNEDPNNPEWVKALVRKGEYKYDENQKIYKVYQGGSNILNETGGVIDLTEGASQDVYVEEIAEILYKKLKTTNPELRGKIDNWIKDMSNILDESGAGGPRGIELFSKFYTFNYMGYKSDVYDLGVIVNIPENILNEFDQYMGEQQDGTNLSFIYKGKDPNIVKTEDGEIKYRHPSKLTREEQIALLEEKRESREDRRQEKRESREDRRKEKRDKKELERESKRLKRNIKKEELKEKRLDKQDKRMMSKKEADKIREDKRISKEKQKADKQELRKINKQLNQEERRIAKEDRREEREERRIEREDRREARELTQEENKELRTLQKEEKILEREKAKKIKELAKEENKLEKIAKREERKLSREESKRIRKEKRDIRRNQRQLKKEQRILEKQSKEVKERIAPLMRIPKRPQVKMGKPIVGDKKSFRIEPVEIEKTKGTFFISGDPVNLNLKGEQEDFGIRYPDTNKGWAVTKGPATRIKNEIAKGNNVIVITAMSDVKGSMLKNPSYLKQLDLATIRKVGRREFNRLMKEFNNDSYKVAIKSKVNTLEVAKKTAVPDFNQIAGKIVAVATVKDVRTGEDRKVKHPAYPHEINFDTYNRLPEPIDFKTFLKDLPDYVNKEGKTVSRSQFGQIMASTYNLSVLRNDSELNSQLIDFALTGDPQTLGVETESIQFASPQIKEIGLDKAIEKINSKELIDFHRIIADLEVALDIESNTKQAVSRWETGAEPTVVTEVTKTISENKLDFLGSMKGLLREQLSILNFNKDVNGPHNLLKIKLGFNIEQINKYTKTLSSMGIEHMTLPITGNKFDLIVVDMDGEVLNLLRKNNYENKTEITKGRATFLGDDTRGKAEQKYLDIYRENSKKYPEASKIFNKAIADYRPRFDLSKLKPQKVKSEESFRLTPSFSKAQQKYIESREWFITKIQDEMRRLKVIQDEIGDIPEEQDAYMRAELYIGKASEKIDQFRTNTVEPLAKELNKSNFTIEDLGDYLYARHSKERNDLILERTDGEKKDGSGMSDKDITLDDGTVIEGSKTILNKFKNTKIKDYAKKIDSIINKTLDVLYDGELITEEDYKHYKSKKMFKHYVPLKGLPGDETYFATGKGFSVTGKDIKRAKGRGSRANNPFVQVLADYEQAIIRAEKNKVNIAFYNLVENNPSEMWEAKGLKHLPRYDKNGELQYLDPVQLKQNEIEAKVDGKRKIITINDKSLLSSMKKMGSSQPIKALVVFNNFFRAINTTLNPEFIVTNFSRDLQAGLFNLGADHKGLTKKVLKYLFKAQKGIWTNIRGGKSEWASIYQEYKDNGGKVGWFEQQTIEQKTEKLEKVLKVAQSKNQFGTAFRGVGKFINDANEMVESGVRLATYKALTDAGVSPKKSAQYSKNLTVNFNKKGEWGATINSLWVFSNASIQGTARILQMGSTKRGKKIIGGLIAMGFLQSFINRMIDEEDWEQFDDYNKDNYWMYLLPNGKAVSIKAPYGFNVFKVMGSLIEEMTFGDTTLPEASKRFLKAIGDAFNPIGGGSPLQTLSPTISDPFFQIMENKNFFGGPIMPDQPPYSPKKADSKRYFKSVRKQSRWVTTWLNKVTGGGEDISGWVDVSPETLDHLIDSYTGGVGKFVANTIETGTSLAEDGKFPSANNIPIGRQFIKDKSEWASRNLLRDMINESKRTKYSKNQIKRFNRHINYMKEADFDRDRYKTKYEWVQYLNKQKNKFIQNQMSIK